MAVELNRDSILEALGANEQTIRDLGVRSLALFGSHARNEGSESSDLDFLVRLDEMTFDGYMDVKEFLESLRDPIS